MGIAHPTKLSSVGLYYPLMGEQIDHLEAFQDDSASSDSTGTLPANRPIILSVIALLTGVLAIGLAVIPGIAMERPLPNPFADVKKEQPPVEPVPEREGGVTLKYKKVSINFGGKVPVKVAKKEPAPAPPAITKDPIRWFTISATVCALVGLILSSIGQLREKHTVLTVSSMGCCAAAITWQYFAVGIAIGAAAAAFLLVLVILGAMFH